MTRTCRRPPDARRPGRSSCTSTSPPTPSTLGSGLDELDRRVETKVLHLARVEEGRRVVTADQVRTWCADPDTHVTVRPVIDLDRHHHVEAYEIPDRLRDQAILRDHTCVFPWCTRPARTADIDHVVPWDTGPGGGATATDNLAPLCRRHHRLKTHATWRYTVLTPAPTCGPAPTATSSSATPAAPATSPASPTRLTHARPDPTRRIAPPGPARTAPRERATGTPRSTQPTHGPWSRRRAPERPARPTGLLVNSTGSTDHGRGLDELDRRDRQARSTTGAVSAGSTGSGVGGRSAAYA